MVVKFYQHVMTIDVYKYNELYDMFYAPFYSHFLEVIKVIILPRLTHFSSLALCTAQTSKNTQTYVICHFYFPLNTHGTFHAPMRFFIVLEVNGNYSIALCGDDPNYTKEPRTKLLLIDILTRYQAFVSHSRSTSRMLQEKDAANIRSSNLVVAG